MPYGVDKKLGGDSKENVGWMEKCVAKVSGENSRTGKPYTKSEKIAICKAQMRKSKSSVSFYEDEIIIDDAICNEVSDVFATTVTKLVDSKRVNTQEAAYLLAESMLAKADYETDLLKFIFNR